MKLNLYLIRTSNNLEKICKAYAMNYAAQFCIGGVKYGQVLFLNDYTEHCFYQPDITKEDLKIISYKQIEFLVDFEITGYLYMGQLGGNEPVPEGQKFRVKETGEIVYLRRGEDHPDYKTFTDNLEGCPNVSASPSEVEPYFE